MVSQNKNLDKETTAAIKIQLLKNKYIAISKAKFKLANLTPQNEIDMLKIEMELGKVKNNMKELEIVEFNVDLTTPFLLEGNEFLLDKIAVSGGGVYTFEINSWNQFIKDFEIKIDKNLFNPTDKKTLFIQNGQLVFSGKKRFSLINIKRKWKPNVEISFEVMQDYEPKKQTIDFYILFNPDTEWRKTFGVFYAFFGIGG